uniref:Uncharacterized protein n=1 Tax=Oryza meridionalis TaxID=40149 RepID=A0A0E0EQ30_9ORYZ
MVGHMHTGWPKIQKPNRHRSINAKYASTSLTSHLPTRPRQNGCCFSPQLVPPLPLAGDGEAHLQLQKFCHLPPSCRPLRLRLGPLYGRLLPTRHRLGPPCERLLPSRRHMGPRAAAWDSRTCGRRAAAWGPEVPSGSPVPPPSSVASPPSPRSPAPPPGTAAPADALPPGGPAAPPRSAASPPTSGSPAPPPGTVVPPRLQPTRRRLGAAASLPGTTAPTPADDAPPPGGPAPPPPGSAASPPWPFGSWIGLVSGFIFSHFFSFYRWVGLV